MTIHHQTVKRAATLGIVLTENPQGEANAHHVERNRVVIHEDAKKAVFLAQLAGKLALEYPHITIAHQEAYAGDESFWNLDDLADENGDEMDLLSEDALDQAFADIVENAPEAGEGEGDEEEGSGKEIVAGKYKEEYRARGDASGCGDWLHVTLKRYTSTAKIDGEAVNVFDDVGFTACLVANGIELKGKWAELPGSGQKGWQGRYRMNGRQKLEIPVCKSGQLALENGTTLTVPVDDLLLLRQLHPALLEEIETAEEEACEAAKKAKPKGKK